MGRPRTSHDPNIYCPDCGSPNVVKCGQWYNFHIQGTKQRYKCGCGRTFFYKPPKMRQCVSRIPEESKK
jgi:transposase-like protein